MSVWRMLFWAFAALMGLVPLNWFRLWATGDLPHGATLTQFLIGTLVCWAIAGGLGYFLVVSAKGIKIRKERETRELEELLNKPLTEIRPSQALVKAGEKAYAAARGSLQESKTVGYSAGTSGVSVRVAKGVTLRASGTRGKAVKGLVNIASGELVITDKRVVFAGDRKSFVIALEDLVNTTNYSDGFGFSDGKSTYTITTENDRERLIFGATMEKVLRR